MKDSRGKKRQRRPDYRMQICRVPPRVGTTFASQDLKNGVAISRSEDMRSLAIAFALSLTMWCMQGQAADYVFEGPWHTTNRKLDGVMTCVVTDLGSENWQGRFYGVWQGVPFDYTVKFSGPPSRLHGTATIDGADYSWTGNIGSGETVRDSQGSFKGTFGGNRYTGYFDLKPKSR